ncbi:Protein of unknown function [Hathewaya proteolytica DSM 3090]|uniref:Uncharacterized protein n=1 Tax=Hathewaya proteolytica DSM 3090 TaxID=1121331 RepID=A0A1M6MQ93_9CLOT|nr:Protein of unknown function [Hathewaya proteolytica DSM 3090]
MKLVRGIVDRFEGDFAVVEMDDESMLNIRKDRLPKGVREGIVLVIEDNCIRIDEEQTKRLEEEIKALEEELWK